MANGTYANNSSSIFYDKPSLDSLGLVGGLVSFYVLVEVCAIVSNATILIAIIRRLVPRTTVNMFFSSLAVSDIIMVVLSLLDCCAYLNGGWEFGEITCKIQSLLLEVSFSASTLTLVAVSCERYLLICQPQMKRRTLRDIYHMLVIVWIIAFIITSPLLDGYIVYEDVDEDAKTRELICGNKGWSEKSRLIYYTTYSMVVYLIPLFLMGFTHWRITKSVRDNHQRQQKYLKSSHILSNTGTLTRYPSNEDEEEEAHEVTEDEDEMVKPHKCHKVLCGPMMQLKKKVCYFDRENKRQEKRMKVVRMLFVVTVSFALLWTPFIILRVVMLAGTYINHYVYKFTEVLILSSTAVNGFIYAYMSSPFRKAFKAILFCQNKGDVMRSCTGTMSNSEDHRRMKTSNISSESQGSTSFTKKKIETTMKVV